MPLEREMKNITRIVKIDYLIFLGIEPIRIEVKALELVALLMKNRVEIIFRTKKKLNNNHLSEG